MTDIVTYSVPRIPDNISTTRYNHALAIANGFPYTVLLTDYPPPSTLQEKFDEVHIMENPSTVSGAFSNIKNRCGILRKLDSNNRKIINITTFHYLPALSGLLSNSKWIVDIYDDPMQYSYGDGSDAHMFGARGLVWMLRFADAGLVTLHPNYQHDFDFETSYLLNGCAQNLFEPCLATGQMNAIWVGKTRPSEGLSILIDALSLSDIEISVDVYGAPYEKSENYAQKTLENGQVDFHGRVPHKKIISRMSNADIGLCILPDRMDWQYSYPIKIGEYLAAGLVPVVSSFPGIKEMVGNAGLCIPPQPEVLADTLENFRHWDNEDWERRSKISLQRAGELNWFDLRSDFIDGIRSLE